MTARMVKDSSVSGYLEYLKRTKAKLAESEGRGYRQLLLSAEDTNDQERDMRGTVNIHGHERWKMENLILRWQTMDLDTL
jgi:hypothetical protein